jgi:hypothetical protein
VTYVAVTRVIIPVTICTQIFTKGGINFSCRVGGSDKKVIKGLPLKRPPRSNSLKQHLQKLTLLRSPQELYISHHIYMYGFIDSEVNFNRSLIYLIINITSSRLSASAASASATIFLSVR